jgi:hypothetical protein
VHQDAAIGDNTGPVDLGRQVEGVAEAVVGLAQATDLGDLDDLGVAEVRGRQRCARVLDTGRNALGLAESLGGPAWVTSYRRTVRVSSAMIRLAARVRNAVRSSSCGATRPSRSSAARASRADSSSPTTPPCSAERMFEV